MTESLAACKGSLIVDVQFALDEQELKELEEPPSTRQFTEWANAAYGTANVADSNAELTIRIVGIDEIMQLNRDYRQQDKATNVLSFPCDVPPGLELDSTLLGDVLICHPVVLIEAQKQDKTAHDHYAHMVVHGVFHLLGHDHQQESDAQAMEALEVKTLQTLSISDPY